MSVKFIPHVSKWAQALVPLAGSTDPPWTEAELRFAHGDR